jgi:hypothetical protein
MYVVATPEFDFTVIDWMNEGPVSALHALVTERFATYADALRFAATDIATEDNENRGI